MFCIKSKNLKMSRFINVQTKNFFITVKTLKKKPKKVKFTILVLTNFFFNWIR